MKCVQEFDMKFYETYLDALMDKAYVLKTLEIEQNTLPNSVTIEIDGISKIYRLKPFKRPSKEGNVFYIENAYILCP